MKIGRIPMMAIGNDELNKRTRLEINQVVKCSCGHRHRVKGGLNQFGKPANLLMFYTCKGKEYLAGVSGKNIMGRKNAN